MEITEEAKMSQIHHKKLTMSGRFAALSRVGTALMSELDEPRLLQLIAETARDLTGAGFAVFTLRPVNELGPTPFARLNERLPGVILIRLARRSAELLSHMLEGGSVDLATRIALLEYP